jgi:tripartite-type tricarboxylate transporter receptor subunit TctC
MRFAVRRSAMWTVAALGLTLIAPVAAQQSYPTKPIRLIVPLAPGGPSDILARSMSSAISPSLGQSVVVDNRTGAGGTIGIDIAAKSPADGYTLLLVAVATYTINASLRLHREFAKALQAPDVLGKLKSEGAEVFATPPDMAAATIRKELDKWAEVIKRTGIKME